MLRKFEYDAFFSVNLAIRSIYDRKALFAKALRKSEEFKHISGFFVCFL